VVVETQLHWLDFAKEVMTWLGGIVSKSPQRVDTLEVTLSNFEETENVVFIDAARIYIETEAGVVAQFLPNAASLFRAYEMAKNEIPVPPTLDTYA